MTDEQIIEGNKLIAKFMKLDGAYTDKGYLTVCRYHTSWDWLMPVVENIESMTVGEKTIRIIIHRRQVSVNIYLFGGMSVPDNKLSFTVNADSKKAATYEAVIKFITWYNQQPKK